MRWSVPKIWEGGECYIIGGGGSVCEQFDIPKGISEKVYNKELTLSSYSQYMEKIHSKHVIGVNVAFQLGFWVDICFFGDSVFFLPFAKRLFEFRGLKVTCSNKKVLSGYSWVKNLQQDKNKKFGISTHPMKVSWNYNSGAAAINLAVHLGVKRILLLGFDMNLTDNKQHWHKEYNKKNLSNVDKIFKRHLQGFPFIARDARKLGVEILNVNPNSAIDSFRKINFKEI